MSPTSRRERRVTASVESAILCSVRQRHNGSTRDQYFLYVAHECSGPCYVMRASIGNGSHPQTYPSETYIGVLDPTYLHTNFALDFFILGYHIRAHYVYDSPFILQCRFVFESPIAYTPIPKKITVSIWYAWKVCSTLHTFAAFSLVHSLRMLSSNG
jgi:hypothetical protein